MRVLHYALLAGCLGPPPREPTPPPRPKVAEERVVLGGDVQVGASWSSTCTDSHVKGVEWTDEKGLGLEREHRAYPCNVQSFYVDVACRPAKACAYDDDKAKYTGSASVAVRTAELGIVEVQLDLIHAETSEHISKLKIVEVVLPDSFGTQCMNPSGTWGSCAAGLSARDQQLRVFPMLGTTIARSAAIRVNGHAAKTLSEFTTGASLADLLGAPLPAGSHTLTLSIGTKQQALVVDVRDE